MVSYFEAIILSIIQGITEWFPISSSGHLALFQNFFGFQNLPYDVFLHFASIFAVIIIFWKDIVKLFYFKKNWRYWIYLIIAMIPAGLVGIFFKDYIEKLFSSAISLGFLFLISGILIYSTKFSKEKKEKLNWFDSFFIGIFQAFAVLPGISRSGFTISSGLFRGLSKKATIRFSFLMAIPLILGASLLKLGDLNSFEINSEVLIISFIITFLVSLLTINFLLKIVKRGKFYLFGIYNFVLGCLVLGWSLI